MTLKMNFHSEQPSRWKPTRKEKGRFWLGISAVSFALALNAYLSVSHELSSGRRGWLYRIFRDIFGDRGETVLWCSIGASALWYGLALTLRKEVQPQPDQPGGPSGPMR